MQMLIRKAGMVLLISGRIDLKTTETQDTQRKNW